MREQKNPASDRGWYLIAGYQNPSCMTEGNKGTGVLNRTSYEYMETCFIIIFTQSSPFFNPQNKGLRRDCPTPKWTGFRPHKTWIWLFIPLSPALWVLSPQRSLSQSSPRIESCSFLWQKNISTDKHRRREQLISKTQGHTF
jgi:hypothetical protein